MSINVLEPQVARRVLAPLRKLAASFGGGGGGGGGTAVAGAAGDGGMWRAVGLMAVREMKLQLSHPGSGRLYGGAISRISGNAQHTHRASAPGEPPAPDTGTLRNSVDFHGIPGGVRVSAHAPYAAYLEFGTLGNGGFIAPRPFMRPAIARLKTLLPLTLQVIVNDALRRVL